MRAFPPVALFSFFVASCASTPPSASSDAGPTGKDAGHPDALDVPDAGPSPLSIDELVRITRVLTSDEHEGRDEGTRGGLAARAFLVGELERCGIEPLTGAGYAQPIVGGNGANLLARIPGSTPGLRDRVVMLSAHYDHIGPCEGDICRGAVDNAAGVALVVGVACALRSSPPARSLIVALWDAEEPPTFLTSQMGSRYFAEHPLVPLASIDVVVVLDLIGGNLWPGFAGHFVVGSETSLEVAQVVRSLMPPAGLPTYPIGFHVAEEWPAGHQAWSDYDPFRNRGVPAILLSDGQNKHYHTPADNLSNIDQAKLAKEGAYLRDLVHALASLETTPAFSSRGPDYAADADTVRTLIQEALAPSGLVDAVTTLNETRGRVEQDLANIDAARARLATGAAATAEDLQAIRFGAQRVLCLAGDTYTEQTCTFY